MSAAVSTGRLAIITAIMAALVTLDSSAVESPKTIELFNGKDTTGWKPKGDPERSQWQACVVSINPAKPEELIGGINNSPDGKGSFFANVGGGSVDIFTEQRFGNGTFEVEFMIPKGSNSGIYVMGEYEIQILDSFGKAKVGPGDLGGLYSNFAPRVNAAKKPGEWQKFIIEYTAPQFEGEKKIANVKFVKVTLNDQVIHENVELKGPTPGGLTGKESATGPLMFQGDHGPVAFRNIRFKPKA